MDYMDVLVNTFINNCYWYNSYSESKTKSSRVLGYVLVSYCLLFTIVLISIIGVKTDVNNTDNNLDEPIIITD